MKGHKDKATHEIVAQVERKRAYAKAWQRQYRHEHPDRVLASRLKQAIKLLTDHGYTVKECGQDDE